jgi:putative membrane protein
MMACHPFGIVGATVALLLGGAAARGAPDRLPRAAHNGLEFVQAVVNADNYRAEAGGLAMKKSRAADVREFGRMLWEDSIEDTRRLKWVLNEHPPGVVLPSTVSPDYMFVIDQLVDVEGNEFDARFIAQQAASLKDTLALTQDYARAGDDFDLKDYAERSVPRIQMQLDRLAAIGIQHARVAVR